jgi:hypothetical protein
MQTLERRLSRRIQRAAERRSCREHTRPRPRGGRSLAARSRGSLCRV